jgi:hypothetical protein
MSPNVAASIKARLLKRADTQGEQLEMTFVRYASERLLYRLGASNLRDHCILKGAGLLTVWMDDPYRATRDIDLLAYGENDDAGVRATMTTICSVPCPEDGLEFDLDTLDVSPIREEDEYAGQRAVLRAYLGKARIRVQVDFGFGDAVVPGPEDARYPTLLDGLPAPLVRTYPRVVTVAEKFEAMVQLGRRNSRMKDFHDVWALSAQFEFKGPELREAVAACFTRRRTGWTLEIPDVLLQAFYGDEDLDARWTNYVRAGAFRAVPPADFEMIGTRVIEFLGPIRESLVSGSSFKKNWSGGGPWK